MRTSKFSTSCLSLARSAAALLVAGAFAACGGNDSSARSGGGGSAGGSGSSANGTGGLTTGVGGSRPGSGGSGNTTAGQGGGASGAGGSGAGGVNGAGGLPGTGGTPVTGGDGAVPIEKLCAHKVTLQTSVFANFENYTGAPIDLATQYGFQWGGATAGTGSGIAGVYGYSGGLTNFMLSFRAGHDATSNWALGYALNDETVYGGAVGFWMNPTCLNASAYRGITFWARGQTATGVFSVVVATEDTTPPTANPAGGGTCPGTADTCKPAFSADLAIGPDWMQHDVTWAMLLPGLRAGVAVQPTGDNIVGLTFQVGLVYVPRSDAGDLDAGFVPVLGSADLQIDDVAFLP